MSVLRHESSWLALVLLLALVVRVGFVIGWHRTHDPNQFELPDSESYWELGRRLAAGEPYAVGTPERRVLRGPGYPLVLAAIFRVFGQDVSPAAARWLGVLLGTLTVGAVYWLARLIIDRRTALIAALVVALLPETVATSVVPLSDGPFCLWMVLQLANWRWAVSGDDKKAAVLAAVAGASGGVATLTRPSWLLFTPLYLTAWLVGRRFRPQAWLLSAAMLTGLVVVMMPWWVRNWQVTGRFVATTLWVGPSLYDGLNPEADGSSNMAFVTHFEAGLQATDAANPPPADAPPFEYRFDRLMRDEAIAWATEHPGHAIRLAVTKLRRMWNIWPNEPAFRSWPMRLAVAATYVPLMLLAIVGAWRLRRQTQDVLLLLAPAVYLSGLHAVFVGSLRYRQPALLTLAILTAAALDAIITRCSIQRTTESCSLAS